jgi:hypothetical protein
LTDSFLIIPKTGLRFGTISVSFAHFKENYLIFTGDNAQQGMSNHNGMPFSTFDHDRDHYNIINCAQMFKSGWWYNTCMRVHLNGVYISPGTTDESAMSYTMFTNSEYISLKTSRMMFRKV